MWFDKRKEIILLSATVLKQRVFSLVPFLTLTSTLTSALASTSFAEETPAAYKYPFTANDRDPLSPLISKSGQILIPRKVGAKNLSLKGIIYSEGKSVVVINDEILREKDIIGDYTVFKIEEKRVILKSKDKEIILKLEEE
jgi:hypothetical protein